MQEGTAAVPLLPEALLAAADRPNLPEPPPPPSSVTDSMELFCVPGTGSAWCSFTGGCINTATERCPAPPYVQSQQLDPCVRGVMGYCDRRFAGRAAEACKYGALVGAQDTWGVAPPAAVSAAFLFPQPFAAGGAWSKESCIPAAVL
jgi:hypothetical protein